MPANQSTLRVMVLGVGAFTHGVLHVLRENGAEASTYLTRDYAHYSPSLEGPTYLAEMYPNPCKLMQDKKIDIVIPMSIDWAMASWAEEFLELGIPILSPIRRGLRLEKERDFARKLCQKYSIPFPKAYVARNRLEAENILKRDPRAYVIKNPLCSPTSPIHTIMCESVEDTRSWLGRLDYAEGIFLQEYLGKREAGHIAFVSGGEIYPLVTNQEYKRAFNDNMGVVAGAPMGGLVEQDPEDKYHLAHDLIHPLLPWFREVGFHGPVQVTAMKRDDIWHVLEYNVRIGITCGPMILRMLERPVQALSDVVHDRLLNLTFKPHLKFGCSLTLAGYGYPFTEVKVPPLPVEVRGEFDCDVWWNEVAPDEKGRLHITGHRIADVAALSEMLPDAIAKTYENIRKIRCVSSYYRTDIGKSLWPPGEDN